MIRSPLLVLAFIFATGLAGPAAGEVVNHPGYAVDSRDELTIMLWFSEELLNASSAPDGISAQWWSTVESTRTRLACQFSGRTADAGCFPLPQPEPAYIPEEMMLEESAGPIDYTAFVALSDLVVVGKVEKVEPGFLVFGTGSIAQRIHVSVGEVIRDTSGSVSSGDELTMIEDGGKLRLENRSACAAERPELPIPEPGARVVLSGSLPEPVEGSHVNAGTLFPLDEETVVVPPGTRFKQGEVSIETLRLAVSLVEEEAGR